MDDITPKQFSHPMIEALRADGWTIDPTGTEYGRFYRFVARKGDVTYEVKVEEIY